MSLAIEEKKQQQRSGGCAGVFFQLREWNRRLAGKKLFSRKLLPPAPVAKKLSKKFGSDKKMPVAKLLLIADENRGGFPVTKKPEAEVNNTSNGMRAPGLVARLMGLESMPVVNHEKPRNAMDYSGPLCSKNHTNDSNVPRHDQDLCREAVGFAKVETRPPKLQKTGCFLERRAINDEQVERSLFCKNAPAQHVRSKHHKHASPLKSPRSLSGCQKARLMQAATKILEPGMQSRNRPRYSIIYMDPTTADARKDEGTDATSVLMKSKELPQDSIFRSSMAYGHMIRDSQANIRKKETMGNKIDSSSFRFTGASSGSDNFMSPGTRIIHSQNEQDMNNTTMFPQAKFSTQNNQHKSVSERKYYSRNEQHLCKPRPDETPISNLKGDNFRQNQPASVRHTVAFGSKVCSRKQDGRDSNEVIGRRIFMSADRSFDSHASCRSAVPVRDGERLEVSRNTWKKNLAGKRTVSSSRIEQIGAANSNPSKEIFGNGLMNRRKRESVGNQSINRSGIKRDIRKEGEDNYSCRDNGIVSFTSNSSMRCPIKSFSCEEMIEKNTAKCELHHGPSKSNVKNYNMESQRNTSLSGNELNNLLNKKIRELTSPGQNELGARNVRYTATILQELISALTFESPISDQSDRINTLGYPIANSFCSYEQDPYDISIPNSQMFNRYKESQKEVETVISGAKLHVDKDQPSPISILEASFSNDSSSRSLDVSSEGKPQVDLTESCSTSQSLDMEIDLLDLANSVEISKPTMERHRQSPKKFRNRVFSKSSEHGLPVNKHQEVVQVLPNVELNFQNFTMSRPNGKVELPLKDFLFGTLETIFNDFPLQNNMLYTETKEADMFKV